MRVVKQFLLAAAAVPLLAVPAFAGCNEDFMAQTKAIPPLQSARLSSLAAPQAEKCAAHKKLVDAYVKLGDIYKTCQAELRLQESDLQDHQQIVTDEQQSYAQDCGV
ncbi:hypothetical protein BWR60_17410 [Inquilinus limosus]|uniref:Uncharacterized protein n=1 Tax=Inquilinus limosus TaxID=171674 RepID=A0A211ZKW8_9PROT|nr:hypothetical protein BWR60_17410 [Inquilinus limosus]